MVPAFGNDARRVFRFPRPRGDGPLLPQVGLHFGEVPPPTRGWSPRFFQKPLHLPGSPAHAGMVPQTARSYHARRRFPRPRGDGPAYWSVSYDSGMVPPPTRGWSCFSLTAPPVTTGSPAHAGMVPRRQSASAVTSRFPRPRGDGPGIAVGRGGKALVPPPTRGWSPCFTWLALRLVWFPRPRGDGPRLPCRALSSTMVPPPTRGWSRVDLAKPGVACGSPAHAGMVP